MQTEHGSQSHHILVKNEKKKRIKSALDKKKKKSCYTKTVIIKIKKKLQAKWQI